MNLIDKYIIAIGRHLPQKNRADIEAEIRSTLEDMLEERNQGKGPANDAMVIELLKEYGSPGEVAATYKTNQHQYLIGPRMYPIFERVLRIVMAIVVGASVLGLGTDLARNGFSGPMFLPAMGQWFGGLFSGLVAAFGNIVLVFAILERTRVLDNEFEKESREWDPKDLNENEIDPDRVDLPDHIATLIFTFLGLIFLNLYPSVLSFRIENNGTWVSIPILAETFFRFLPWINVLGLVQMGFNGYMLSRKEWKPVTRVVSILSDIAGMILAVVIMRTPGIIGVTPESLTKLGLGESAETLSPIFNFIPLIVIVVVVVVTAIKVWQSSSRLLKVNAKSPYPFMK